jgi:hypothetical protein
MRRKTMSATQTQTEAAQTQTADADALARVIAENMTAGEIRAWMSDNGLTRSRGARKHESVLQAHEQDPALVQKLAEHLEGDYGVTCTCGLEETFATAGDAEDFARAHKSLNHTHFPRARGPEDERIYG